MRSFSIGIDVGGTNIKAAVLDQDRQVIHTASFPSLPMPGPTAFVSELVGIADAVIDSAGIRSGELRSVGVGLPGIVSGETVHRLPNLGISDLDLGRELTGRLGTPVYLDNDANAAALGEHLLGAGQGFGEMILLTLGTGLGGGAISGGRIMRGSANLCAEFGHMILNPDGPECSCGNCGCFETYCSATGLIRHIKKAAPRYPDSVIFRTAGRDLSALDARMPFDGYREDDALCTEVVRRFMAYLSHGLYSLVSVFNPELIILAGGISNQGAWMIDELSQSLDARLMHKAQRAAIKQAALGGYAGAFGAALLYTQAG